MKVPDEVRKTVGFVAYYNRITDKLEPVGSMFFLGHDPLQGETMSRRVYVVTAKHVIDRLRRLGCEDVGLRLNAKSENPPLVEIRAPIARWFCHPRDPTIDVAIMEMGIPDMADHLVIPYAMAATQERLVTQGVGVGDEVFISGLFRHHYGNKRNVPIVRVGNLAAMNEERIQTSLGEMDAYLIEARSLGGLSGSPVFLNLGAVRQIGRETRLAANGAFNFLLMGLAHGHIETAPGDSENEKINSGIAIVVPITRVIEVISLYESEHHPLRD